MASAVLNQTCNSTSSCIELMKTENAYDPAVGFDESEVGWVSFRGEYRLLQPFWKLTYILIGKGGIESPMSVALIPVIFYFTMVVFFTICDLWGQNWHWIQKYKIQSNKKATKKVVWKALKLTFWNHMLLFAPIFMMQYITQQPKIIAEPLAPPFLTFVFKIIAMIFLFDFQYFVWHYMHHRSRRLYKWCHILHHEFHAPIACSTQYLHPWEIFCVGVYNGILPVLFNCCWMTTNAMSFLNIYMSVLAHCGYDLPIDVNHFFPAIAGGCKKHDMHHLKPYTNFQPYLSTLDRWMGTECPGMDCGGVKSAELVEWEKTRETKAAELHEGHPERHVENCD